MATASVQADIRNAGPMERFDAYVDGVSSGEIVACEYVKLAVKRHVRDLERSERGELPFRFDEAIAKAAIQFLEVLPMCKGREFANKPLHLEPWECFIVGSLLGVSEQPLTDRFLRRRQSPVICHPIMGKAFTSARSTRDVLVYNAGQRGETPVAASIRRGLQKTR